MHAPTLIPLALALVSAFPAFAIPLDAPRLPETRATAPPTASTPADQAYRRALQSLAGGDLKAAEQAFQQALKLDPKSAKAMLGLAEVAFRDKKLDQAGQWIQRAVQAAPASSEAQASLGRFFALQGKNKEAEAALRKAAALDAAAVRPRVNLGDMLSAQGRLADAVKFYRQALASDPQHAGAHYALGIALARLGENTQAQAELEHAARLEPKNPLPQLGLARLYAGMNDPGKALLAVDRALALQPGLVDALLLRGDQLDVKGQSAEAIAAWQAAAKSAPRLALPQMKIAMTAHRTGQIELAQASYKKAIELDPKQAIAYNNLAALALERKQDLAQAETWGRKAVELAPGAADFHDTLGWILRARGNAKGALAALQKAARLAPKNPEIQYHLGALYAETGDKPKARVALKQALAAAGSFPSAAEARKLLASLER